MVGNCVVAALRMTFLPLVPCLPLDDRRRRLSRRASIARLALLSVVALIPATARASYFTVTPLCDGGDGTTFGSEMTCYYDTFDTNQPGSIAGGYDVPFDGYDFLLSSRTTSRYAGTYDIGTMTTSGDAAIHVDAAPPPANPFDDYIGTNAASGGMGATSYDLLTAYDPALPDGAPLIMRFDIPIRGTGSNGSSGNAAAEASFKTGWWFNDDMDSRTFDDHSSTVHFATTVGGAFAIQNNVPFRTWWTYSAEAFASGYVDSLDFPAAADASSTLDSEARLYFVSEDPNAIVTSGSGWDYSLPATAVPEPGTAVLLGVGLVMLAARRRAGRR